MAFCAPFCASRSDGRFMDAVSGDIGYEAYGKTKAKAWHELMDRFQVACIKHRDTLQEKYYQEAKKQGIKLRESFFGTDEKTQAERLWELNVNEFPIGFWQYYQEILVDAISKAVDDDDPDEIYDCMMNVLDPSGSACNGYLLPYSIQSACEMGNYTEDYDHLREIVAAAKKTAPEEYADNYYVATKGNPSCANVILTKKQLATFKYDGSTRKAMTKWMNSTKTAQLIMVYGESDPWYFVRPGLSFTNDRIMQFASTSNHTTTIADLSEADQATVWKTLDTWLAADDPQPLPTPDSDENTGNTAANGNGSGTSTTSAKADDDDTDSSTNASTDTDTSTGKGKGTTATSTARTADDAPLAAVLVVLVVTAGALAASRRRVGLWSGGANRRLPRRR